MTGKWSFASNDILSMAFLLFNWMSLIEMCFCSWLYGNLQFCFNSNSISGRFLYYWACFHIMTGKWSFDILSILIMMCFCSWLYGNLHFFFVSNSISGQFLYYWACFHIMTGKWSFASKDILSILIKTCFWSWLYGNLQFFLFQTPYPVSFYITGHAFT